MVSKIYVVLFAAATAVMAFFTYYANSWLQSIGAPSTAVSGFEYHFSMAFIFLWVSTLALLVAANIVLWLSDKAWAIWATLLYFVVFILCRVWLLCTANEFQKANSLPLADAHGVGQFVLFGLCIIGAIFVFCDQFAIVRLKRTMYASADPSHTDAQPESSEPPTDGE